MGRSRVDNYSTTLSEIQEVHPDRVIASIGRTSGPGCSNIDYLEAPGRLVDNLRDNLQGPLNLAMICQSLGIHFTYIGTGCIYEHDQDHPIGGARGFTEDDPPNFFGSQYSMVKSTTDCLIRHCTTTLNARIRMPLANNHHPRNFITKITQYPKVISIPNSMTVLPELLPFLLDLARKGHLGTINLTNPGTITHQEILELYKQKIDPSITYQIIDLDQLSHYTIGKRSNNMLDTTRLESLYPNVKPIKMAVEDLISSFQLK